MGSLVDGIAVIGLWRAQWAAHSAGHDPPPLRHSADDQPIARSGSRAFAGWSGDTSALPPHGGARVAAVEHRTARVVAVQRAGSLLGDEQVEATVAVEVRHRRSDADEIEADRCATSMKCLQSPLSWRRLAVRRALKVFWHSG